MIKTMTVLKDNMKKVAQGGFINATDLADYLTKKGVAFRDAYKVCGKIVGECIKRGKVLEDLSLDEFKTFNENFESDVFDAIDLTTCVNSRSSFGGTCVESVEMQIDYVKNKIK
jgi:argininosuccinate lyase